MISITPSHIIQHLYCPRFTYFEYVLRVPQYEEDNYKVLKGRHLHERREKENKDYLRKRIGVVALHREQYLTNGLLRGKIDEVLLLRDGSAAPLDYKFAKWEGKVYKTYATQLACYAWLIRDNFNKDVTRGYLVYTRSAYHLESVVILEQHIDKVKKATERIANIICENRYPKPTRCKQKCLNCTYRKLCVQ